MPPLIVTPISFLISLSVLSGLFVNDFRLNDITRVASVAATSINSNVASEIKMFPATATPDIATNWFSGSTAGVSYQLPAAQARNDDKDKYVAQGRVLDGNFGSDDF